MNFRMLVEEIVKCPNCGTEFDTKPKKVKEPKDKTIILKKNEIPNTARELKSDKLMAGWLKKNDIWFDTIGKFFKTLRYVEGMSIKESSIAQAGAINKLSPEQSNIIFNKRKWLNDPETSTKLKIMMQNIKWE